MWLMYYADDSTFSSKDGLPEDSPKDFLVCIMQKSDFGSQLLIANHYIFRGRWYGHDLFGLLDQVQHHAKEITAVRHGYYTEDENYREIVSKAKKLGFTIVDSKAGNDYPLFGTLKP